MKSALCISGQMRTYKKCYGYLKENIISELQPDIFIYTKSKTGITTKADYNNESDNKAVKKKNLRKIYDPEEIFIDEPFEDKKLKSFKGVEVPKEIIQQAPNNWKGNIPNFYGIKKCNEMKKEKEKKDNFKYDLVIRCRPDLVIKSKIPNKILKKPEILWHNHEQSPIMVSDQLAMSSSENMDYYSSVWDKLNEYWKNPLGDRKWENIRVGERLLKTHMKKSKIEVDTCEINYEILRSRTFVKNKLKNRYKNKAKKMIYNPTEIIKTIPKILNS
ncbi:hypothetical protein [Salinibacter ruber]|uniref:hypothetical protein n=1 Tax=Salinibacter ruber TaxID=146919 RepID=UPI002072AE0B|nr:hypothetical protein [Salinibacter ruber]